MLPQAAVEVADAAQIPRCYGCDAAGRCSSDSSPSLGTSMCPRCEVKSKKKDLNGSVAQPSRKVCAQPGGSRPGLQVNAQVLLLLLCCVLFAHVSTKSAVSACVAHVQFSRMDVRSFFRLSRARVGL